MPPAAMPLSTCCRNSSIRRAPTSVAQIGAAHRLLVLQLRTLALDRDTTDLEHIGARRELERDARVLLDQQHRHPVALVDCANDVEDRPHYERRQPERRLIEQQQLRPHEKGPREREHLLLAT